MKYLRSLSAIKLYSIGLVLSITILLITAAISYQQIKGLQESSNLVNHSMMVDKEINRMFSSYALLKSTELDYIVNKNEVSLFLLKNYRDQSEDAVQKLKLLTANNEVQQKNLERMEVLRTDFLGDLETVMKIRRDKEDPIDADLKGRMLRIAELLEKIRVLKDKMVESEEFSLKEEKEKYSSLVAVTPLATLATALFSIFIFGFAFWKIITNRKKMENTSAFLGNILQSVSNVVSHFEAIRNKSGLITDFSIVFTNERISAATGDKPEIIEGKRISEVYPFLFENGVFDLMVECVDKSIVKEFEREYDLMVEKKIFKSTVIKLGDGLVLTSENVTVERNAALRLEDFNQTLSNKNVLLNNAETLGKIGSYSFNIEKGTAKISENFYTILGYGPNAFEMTFERFKSFVHPEDLEIFLERSTQIFKRVTPQGHYYRIVAKDGKTKYLMATGHFEKKDKNVFVGIVQDITEERKRKQHLEDKNLELLRRNEELDSFNHVTSHDLQEPLRKIQMFTSLIKSNNNLDNDDEKFFSTIQSAAQRMQTLIKNLLAYSRIGSENMNFVKVNLNDVLSKVRDDLEMKISETKAIIVVNELSEVLGLAFHMEQLFTNLISNSLKYSNPEREVKILIFSENVHRSQINADFQKRSSNYHKISVIDNGIGFSSEYAMKIFELFQRLHGKNDYSGTGLGLAICKKIIENHNGFISATATEGEGATFTIYFPES